VVEGTRRSLFRARAPRAHTTTRACARRDDDDDDDDDEAGVKRRVVRFDTVERGGARGRSARACNRSASARRGQKARAGFASDSTPSRDARRRERRDRSIGG